MPLPTSIDKVVSLLKLQPHPEGGFFSETFRVVEINEAGKKTETVLGHDWEKGQVLQHPVPPGVWFGTYQPYLESQQDYEYSLVGCTVAPGFDFGDFEMGDSQLLLADYPAHRDIIEKLFEGTAECQVSQAQGLDRQAVLE